MIASERVRDARKKAQLARLDKKGKKDYAKYYANQPLQKVKAAKNEELRSARQALKDAAENLAVAEVTGENLEAAQESAAIANLVVTKLEDAKRGRPVVSLTG
jgi:hypothetical protein